MLTEVEERAWDAADTDQRARAIGMAQTLLASLRHYQRGCRHEEHDVRKAAATLLVVARVA